jgi:hypothetical protein
MRRVLQVVALVFSIGMLVFLSCTAQRAARTQPANAADGAAAPNASVAPGVKPPGPPGGVEKPGAKPGPMVVFPSSKFGPVLPPGDGVLPSSNVVLPSSKAGPPLPVARQPQPQSPPQQSQSPPQQSQSPPQQSQSPPPANPPR